VNALVLGHSGQLATHLREMRPEALFWGREVLDLARPELIEAAVLDTRPTAIVNAAAYTAVDRAETEPDLAWRINALAPAALARAAARLDVPLIQVSTDFVFDGTSPDDYDPDAPTAPLNAYGYSKLGGELAAAALCRRHWILRASWLFSEHGHNFVKTVIRLAREAKPLSVVDDQIGRPTYARALAEWIDAFLHQGTAHLLPPGVYHFGAGPALSWHRFAVHLLQAAQEIGLLTHQPEARAVTSDAYAASRRGVVAARPPRSVLRPSPDLDRVAPCEDWRAGLARCLSRLATRQADEAERKG